MENAIMVCSMCGDIGFPDKLFRCVRCHSRIQHSYCTNYYDERTAGVCDWCLSEERSGQKHGLHSKKSPGRDGGSDHKAVKAENADQEESRNRGGKSSASSSKPTGRRYKLLKDVLC